MLKSISTLVLLVLFTSITCHSQQKPEKVIWGEKLKKTKNLGTFIYKDDFLYAINFKMNAIQKFSPGELTLVSTLELADKKINLDGVEIDLFNSIESLINYKDGLGLFIASTNPDDLSKSYGFVKLASDLSSYDEECESLFESEGDSDDKRENRNLHHDSKILEGNKNYLAIMSYRLNMKDKMITAHLDIISNNGKDESKEFTFHQDDEKSGVSAVFSENAYLTQTWTETTNELILYDGITGESKMSFSLNEYLESDCRVLSIKKMSNDEFVLAGFFGKFDRKEGNEMHGLFQVRISATGRILDHASSKYLISEISTTQEKTSVDEVLITDEGNVFFVMTSSTGEKISMNGSTTVYEQMMIIGINNDEMWSKSIPFRQGYGAMVWDEHLGPKIAEINGHLIVSFNDHRDNGKQFDYNNYTYSKDTRPSRYTCSLPDVIAIMDIDTDGEVKSYFINVYDIFTNLIDIMALNDGTLFFSGGTATIAGAGKTLFGRVILE